MSKKWSEHNEEEQAKVWEAIAKVYEEAGYPEGLKAPVSSGEYVNVLMANVSQEAVKGPQITGSFPPDKKSVADDLTGKFKKALEGVSDSKVEVAAKFDVGATFFRLHVRNCGLVVNGLALTSRSAVVDITACL